MFPENALTHENKERRHNKLKTQQSNRINVTFDIYVACFYTLNWGTADIYKVMAVNKSYTHTHTHV